MEMEETNNKIYKASKKSIEKAIDILKSSRTKSKTDKEKREILQEQRTKYNCTSSIRDQRLTHYGSIYFKEILISKMYDCLMSREWDNMLHMFSLLLSKSFLYKEQIVWRYAVLIMLYYPERTEENIVEFLKLFVGCRDDTEIESMLQEILTFPPLNLFS